MDGDCLEIMGYVFYGAWRVSGTKAGAFEIIGPLMKHPILN